MAQPDSFGLAGIFDAHATGGKEILQGSQRFSLIPGARIDDLDQVAEAEVALIDFPVLSFHNVLWLVYENQSAGFVEELHSGAAPDQASGGFGGFRHL